MSENKSGKPKLVIHRKFNLEIDDLQGKRKHQEFFDITPFYRSKRGRRRLSEYLPEWDIQVKQIIDTEGAIPFRRLWYAHERQQDVEEFLHQYAFCMAFRKRGSSVWLRVNRVQSEPFSNREVRDLKFGWHEKKTIRKKSKKYGDYKYEKWIYKEEYLFDLLRMHKMKMTHRESGGKLFKDKNKYRGI